MEQYINKSDLLAIIEKRQNILDLDNPLGRGGMVELECLKNTINTMEVKEVDLNKEIDKELETRWRGEYLYTNKFRESAKHFYELGLKTQKGE